MRGAALLVGTLLVSAGCEDAFMIEVRSGGTDMARAEVYLGVSPCEPGTCDAALPMIPRLVGTTRYLADAPEPFGADGTGSIVFELRPGELGDRVPVAIIVGFDASKKIVGSAVLHDLDVTESVIYRIDLTPLETPGHRLWFARQPIEPHGACVGREKSPDAVDVIVPRGDSDCDGLDEASDLCPTVHDPQQRDFDKDSRPDACDPCPHLGGAAPFDPDLDRDGDGVGDGCDPAPTISGDRRALWSGFYDGADLDGWTQTSGTWAVEPTGGVSQTALVADAWLRSDLIVDAAFIQSRYRVSALAMQSSAEIGVCAAQQATNGQNICCDVLAPLNLEPVIETWWNDMTGLRGRTSAVWNADFSAAEVITLTHQVVGQTSKCVGAGPTGALAQSTMAITAETSGGVSLYMKRATARFDYVFVVEPAP